MFPINPITTALDGYYDNIFTIFNNYDNIFIIVSNYEIIKCAENYLSAYNINIDKIFV